MVAGPDPARSPLRDGAALVDRGHRGRLAISGEDRAEALNGIVTNDVTTLTPGTGQLAAVLTPKGKMLGELRVLHAGDELLLDMERVALQPVFDALRHGLVGFRADLHKRTLERGELSLLGPRARELAGAPELPAEEHANAAGQIGGAAVRLIATDAGVDVLCDAADTERVRAALLAAGAAEATEDDADVLRVEHGRPRYGVDLDDTVIPQEAGLNERAVSFTKGCYVGQETVARLFYKGKPNRHLRGLRLSAPAPTGAALRLGEREVGTLTSSVAVPGGAGRRRAGAALAAPGVATFAHGDRGDQQADHRVQPPQAGERVAHEADEQRRGERRAEQVLPALAARRGRAELVGQALLGDAEDRHDDQRAEREADAEQRRVGAMALGQGAKRFERDVRREQEELGGHEALSALLGPGRVDAMHGEAPDDHERGEPLDDGVEPEADERDRPGEDAGGDRDRALRRDEDERDPREVPRAAREPLDVRAVGREGRNAVRADGNAAHAGTAAAAPSSVRPAGVSA
ncbi:MAG: hypothetical protein MUC84_04340 [Solirubrobacteraceae bacterium]|nr:hypothetical protein [Solirubrobacteraceae bacterium]